MLYSNVFYLKVEAASSHPKQIKSQKGRLCIHVVCTVLSRVLCIHVCSSKCSSAMQVVHVLYYVYIVLVCRHEVLYSTLILVEYNGGTTVPETQ